MNRELKEAMEPALRGIGRRHGIENFVEMIADETVAQTEEEVLEYITRMSHPALSLPPLF
jgi:acetyl-CoA synthase